MVARTKLKEIQERKRLITSRDELLRSLIQLDCEQIQEKKASLYAKARPYLPFIAGSVGFLAVVYRRQMIEQARRIEVPKPWLQEAARRLLNRLLS